MEQFDRTVQADRCRKLIAAIVAQALKDSVLRPGVDKKNKRQIFNSNALTGIDFLMNHGAWCFHFLDLDQDQFCKKLVDRMYSQENMSEFDRNERIAFRENYQQYLNTYQENV